MVDGKVNWFPPAPDVRETMIERLVRERDQAVEREALGDLRLRKMHLTMREQSMRRDEIENALLSEIDQLKEFVRQGDERIDELRRESCRYGSGCGQPGCPRGCGARIVVAVDLAHDAGDDTAPTITVFKVVDGKVVPAHAD